VNTKREYLKEFKWGFPLQISPYKLLESYNTSSTEFLINVTLNYIISTTNVLVFMESILFYTARKV
jgi:hypothetical protein